MGNGYKYRRLSKDDAVVLLIDHQSGLISLVQDYPPNEFKNNVLALAAVAGFFRLPTILTTSFEEGPNGPLVPELKNRAGSCQSGAPAGTTVSAWPRIESNEAARTSSLQRSSAMSIPSR